MRLPEARQLIQKALEFAPGDPFISDSLAWVEFRMGNNAEALRILQAAYKDRPDPEIAAHLGEVLWTLGQREKAQGRHGGRYLNYMLRKIRARQAAEDARVLATPTLIKRLPPPLRRVIGDLSDKEKVLLGLEVSPPLEPPVTGQS